MTLNPQTETPDSGPSLRGRIAPNSLLDRYDQLQLYREQMGHEAAARQLALARRERERKRRR